MTEPRICAACKHFLLDLGSETYSENTIGSPGEMACAKKHWHLDCRNGSLRDARRAMRTAETCGDYGLYSEDANGP